jgi:hypothetical protein
MSTARPPMVIEPDTQACLTEEAGGLRDRGVGRRGSERRIQVEQDRSTSSTGEGCPVAVHTVMPVE